jgi:small-conductance mechanosensitive channel
MDKFIQWIHQTLLLNDAAYARVLGSVAVILGLWLVNFVAGRIVHQGVTDVRAGYRLRKAVGYIVLLVGVLAISRIWIRGLGSLSTFLGLLSAGLAIALKDPVSNFAGWVFLVTRRPFEVGDRVQIGGYGGDVIDIRIFQFTLLEVGNWVDADQSTGRVIHVPNGMVFTQPVANYSKGFEYIWDEIPVLVTFESNWEKAKKILTDIATKHERDLSEAAVEKVRQAARKFLILYGTLTPTVYTSVKESGVMLTIRYLCEPRRRRNTSQAIWEDVLRAFAACDDVDFAYPTERRFNNAQEAKPAMRPRE